MSLELSAPFILIRQSFGLIQHRADGIGQFIACGTNQFSFVGLDDELQPIGDHFPDTDPAYRDIDSLILLTETGKLLARKGYAVGNLDAVVIAQAPKIAPYRGQMEATLARTLDIAEDQVSVKATTTEGLGLFGREEGIGAPARALLSVPMRPTKSPARLLWLMQVHSTREWSSRDRDLSEELIQLLARAADKGA